jgi:hypothetical protein
MPEGILPLHCRNYLHQLSPSDTPTTAFYLESHRVSQFQYSIALKNASCSLSDVTS